MSRIFFALFLFAFPAFAGECDKPQDDDSYLYFKGTGVASSEEDAVERAEAEAVRQAHQIFGLVVSSNTLSYETENMDTSSSSSEQSVQSLAEVRLKGFFKKRDCPVSCKGGRCKASVIYKYSRKEYEKEKQRLDDIEMPSNQKKRDVETFGRETKTSRRVSFFFDDTKTGLPAAEFKDIDFELNGRKYAVTPLTHFHLEPGRYDIHIDHPRYDAVYDDMLTVTSDTKKLVAQKVGWKKAFAHIKVGSNPSGAEVYIDGKKVKKTPMWRPFPLIPGVHKIKLVHPDYADYDTEVNIPKGEKRELNIDLPRKGASFTLRVTPADADVYLDGKKLSERAPFRDYPIPPDIIQKKLGKARIFVVAKEGYEDFSYSEELKYGGSYRKEATLKSLPTAENGSLESKDKFVFIPPAVDGKDFIPLSVLSASGLFDRSKKKLKAFVRIDPEKYQRSFLSPIKEKINDWPKKMQPVEQSFPMDCRPKRGCKPEDDIKGKASAVYVRTGDVKYGFFSDSAPFLPVDGILRDGKFRTIPNRLKLYLIVRVGKTCTQKFDFYMNLLQRTRSGLKMVDPVLSDNGNTSAGKENLMFTVKKCQYRESDPVLLKVGKGE